MKIAIVGAGIVGRLVAWHLCQYDVEIHLFTQGTKEGEDTCSLIAAGMISPISECATIGKSWQNMAMRALSLWPQILASLSEKIFYHATGTLVVTHPQQQALLMHFMRYIQKYMPQSPITLLSENELHKKEPHLSSLMACFVPEEACIDTVQLFRALEQYLTKMNVMWHEHTLVAINQQEYDHVFDCTGMGARKNLKALRGVRGELLICHAQDVCIRHMIRLLHARHACYIVPREKQQYVIGATQIESESEQSISVRSALTLLSGAIAVHPGFWDATIEKMHAKCRPTLPDNAPIVHQQGNITYINGMFRHGFLFAPVISASVCEKLLSKKRRKNANHYQ